jgi:pilus assembly protein Flp/PilA
MKNVISRFVREDKGQDLIEYALLATVVSMGAFLGAQALGTALNTWYNAVGTSVNTAATQVPTL